MTLARHYLLVDDTPQDRFLAQEAFEHLCPECVLTCVASGREALKLLQGPGFEPDVMLLDLNMPGMSGFQVLQAMKEDARLAHIPVVILSTSSAQQDVRQAYTLHASSYLIKSVSFADFLEQLEQVLRYWEVSRTVHDKGWRSKT